MPLKGAELSRMPRGWLGFQLVLGWAPLWALFIALLMVAHPGNTLGDAVGVATRMAGAGALLGPLVGRVVRRLPWPRPVTAGFVTAHLLLAAGYAVTWYGLNSAVHSVVAGRVVLLLGFNLGAYLIMGVWLYVMNAGVLYASEASARVANAQLQATQAQLAALRGQVNPHFLFNALHTVVQLIPRAPDRAARAAEDIAGLLRTSMEERRDLVPLEDEWRFVARYLEMEGIRFGERLRTRVEIEPGALPALLPSFALQTLVENAVRHGASPREAPTTIAIRAARVGEVLEVEVMDDGAGIGSPGSGAGTGLQRLRERLAGHFGAGATVELRRDGAVTRAVLRLPWRSEGE